MSSNNNERFYIYSRSKSNDGTPIYTQINGVYFSEQEAQEVIDTLPPSDHKWQIKCSIANIADRKFPTETYR